MYTFTHGLQKYGILEIICQSESLRYNQSQWAKDNIYARNDI
jgi:hypothetical protein